MVQSLSEFEKELEALLSEGVEDARERESSSFDRMTKMRAAPLVLFGAGNLGRRTLAGLRKNGIEPLCFLDNNEALWENEVDGLPVLNPAIGAKSYSDTATFIITIWRGEGTDRMPDREAQLRALGCSNVMSFLPLFWKYPGLFLPHYLVNLPHCVHLQADAVRQGLHLMADDASRLEYLAQLHLRLLGDFAGLPQPVSGSTYFREELFRLRKDELFVDCGAFDGDTISQFLSETKNSFQSVVAFEPDPANYSQLVERMNLLPFQIRQRIHLHQAATSDEDGNVPMTTGKGVSSYVGSGDCEVACVALDSVLRGAPVTFIKMDIEGSELFALDGSQTLIRDNAPILAICVYHRQDDLWKIPQFIHSLNPGYKIYLRPHLLEGWDLVCYAVPESRR